MFPVNISLEIYKKYNSCNLIITASKVSKYGVFSGPYFLVFSQNTGKYGPEKTPYFDTFHAVYLFLPVSIKYNRKSKNLLTNNIFEDGLILGMCTEHKTRFFFNTFFSKWEKIRDYLQTVYI